jgi:hypothetical protein
VRECVFVSRTQTILRRDPDAQNRSDRNRNNTVDRRNRFETTWFASSPNGFPFFPDVKITCTFDVPPPTDGPHETRSRGCYLERIAVFERVSNRTDKTAAERSVCLRMGVCFFTFKCDWTNIISSYFNRRRSTSIFQQPTDKRFKSNRMWARWNLRFSIFRVNNIAPRLFFGFRIRLRIPDRRVYTKY